MEGRVWSTIDGEISRRCFGNFCKVLEWASLFQLLYLWPYVFNMTDISVSRGSNRTALGSWTEPRIVGMLRDTHLCRVYHRRAKKDMAVAVGKGLAGLDPKSRRIAFGAPCLGPCLF